MKANYLNKFIMLTIITILGFGVNSFAKQGVGYCNKWCVNNIHGQNKFCNDPYCMDKLSKEQIQKIREQQKTFFDTTEDQRQKLYEKRTELISVLAKKEPDAEQARAIQKEISYLESQIDQKRIDYIIKIKEINPYCNKKIYGIRSSNKGLLDSHFRGQCW